MNDWFHILERIVIPNWQNSLGLILAFLVGASMIRQRRRQSNIVAWTLLILVFPILGIFLFLLIGGRKHRRTVATKRAINALAGVFTHKKNDFADSDAEWTAMASVPPSAPKLGHAITVLDDADGTATWETLRDEIAVAKNTIHITTYCLGCDVVGRSIIEMLAARAHSGVQVRLLMDAVGSFGARLRVCRPLLDAGGAVERFMPVLPFPTRGSANLRNHRKMAIFDGQRAIVGGQNLATEYIGPCPNKKRFRDFSVRIDGPAVADLTRIFLSDWCFASGQSPTLYRELLGFQPCPSGTVRTKVVSGGPDEPTDPVWEHFVSLIQECRKEITLVTPYLVPDEVLLRALLAKLHAGRRVRLIVPLRSDHRFLDLARRPYLRALHRAGAQILLYNQRILHGKLFLVDGNVAGIGSANMDMRSLFVNFEVAAFIYSPNSVRRLRMLANKLAAECQPYAGSKLEAGNWQNRTLEMIAHMVGPLL
jgi:cardiolipin synthase